ncbi:GNAT family N-acetyltransferase [Calidifontibacter indicus]|uniref:Putative acetyltransferase n=1 Tax=Calidifontibacter indicus TaxID=419650 RepID=A0A3D9UZV3_9MICO|nr:GNAT family N-acetyltransferase [Calidifontibacter indicus]REF30341.1 putative acetyltransferase [Calidifontibacter indicus]
MITLVEPSEQLRDSWRESRDEFRDSHIHGYSIFGFTEEELATDDGFDRWLAQQRRNLTDPPEGYVPSALYWIVDDEEPARVLGSLNLRFALNDFLREQGGHIGYGVRASARRRGVATAALMASLDKARERGMDRVLVTCETTNLASARTIERCGGVLEDVRGDKRRYWITL